MIAKALRHKPTGKWVFWNCDTETENLQFTDTPQLYDFWGSTDDWLKSHIRSTEHPCALGWIEEEKFENRIEVTPDDLEFVPVHITWENIPPPIFYLVQSDEAYERQDHYGLYSSKELAQELFPHLPVTDLKLDQFVEKRRAGLWPFRIQDTWTVVPPGEYRVTHYGFAHEWVDHSWICFREKNAYGEIWATTQEEAKVIFVAKNDEFRESGKPFPSDVKQVIINF